MIQDIANANYRDATFEKIGANILTNDQIGGLSKDCPLRNEGLRHYIELFNKTTLVTQAADVYVEGKLIEA